MVDLIKKIKLYSSKEERMAKYEGSDKVISSHDYKKEIEAEKEKEIYSFKSDFPMLDKITEGFETGELIVLSGYTGHGKTSIAQSFTVNFEKQNIKTLWFSYEMPARQFFAKFQSLPLFYLPKELKESTMKWIEEKILEAKIKYDIRVVMIDHLHFLLDFVRSKYPSLEIGTIVRSLKSLAMKHNIVIFLIAHTSMPKGKKSPGLEDIRDSSFITQEADSAMVIQRILPKGTKIYGNDAWLTVLKHRRMGTIGRGVKLFYKDKQFYELSDQMEDV